jgi:molybdate transport system substrate-binding protein
MLDRRSAIWILCIPGLLGSCGQPRAPKADVLTVAAAANLMDVFRELGSAFKARTGVEVIFSYGSTAQLAAQIENGAPFDVFAAADTEHIDSLLASHKLTDGTRAIYAKGQLALWAPQAGSGIGELRDVMRPQVRFIAVAQPELAPYGHAAVEALRHANLWEAVKSKVVYANSISVAKQLAASGNAEVAFTAYSLVLHEAGLVLKVDPALYPPIEQAAGIVASSPRAAQAAQFRSFLLGPEGRALLVKNGYLAP